MTTASAVETIEGQDQDGIRIFLVDDSAVVRHIVGDVVRREFGLALAGTAGNGLQALERIDDSRADVVVLDVEMPELDGRQTLVQIRKRWPNLPVIMFSSLSDKAAAATFDCMASGAKDFVAKPTMAGSPANAIANVRANLVPVVRAWGEVTRRASQTETKMAPSRKPITPRRVVETPTLPGVHHQQPTIAKGRIAAIVMASSTGGPNALGQVIPMIPGNIGVPLFLVQHMPPMFTKHLAERLDSMSELTVHEAADGLPVEPGHLYIAQGGRHMVVTGTLRNARVDLDDGPPENSCRPAADVLFRSAVSVWGGQLLSVILTGMGRDGLDGSRAVTDAGGRVIAQNQETSVVWGMPGSVAQAGLTSEIHPLNEIAAAITRLVGSRSVTVR